MYAVTTICFRHCDKPRIIEQIKQIIRDQNKLHKKAKSLNTDQQWKNFRQIRNFLIDTVMGRKLDYLHDLENFASSSATIASKNRWKLAKSVMSNKRSSPDVTPSPEKDGNTY